MRVYLQASIGIGLLIEMWKIPKCLDVKVDYNDKILGVIPKVRFSDKGWLYFLYKIRLEALCRHIR